MPKITDIASMVSDVVGKLLGETPAGQGGAAQRQPGPIEMATGAIAEFLEKTSAGIPFLRFQPRTGRDLLVARGEPVELSVQIDAVRGLTVERVRFHLGSRVVGEAAVNSERAAYLLHTPEDPGLFPLRYDLVGTGGRTLRDEAPTRETVLQVVDGRPVAAVAAGLVLGRNAPDLGPISALVRRGWALCYIDLDERDRTGEIRDAARRSGLPEGAVLAHPATEAEFKTMGVDFRKVFAQTTWRRLRASGVPLVLLVCEDPATYGLDEEHGSRATDLAGLETMLADERSIVRVEHLARSFAASRDASQSRFAWRLDCMTGVKPVPGNRLAVEFENRAARQTVLEAVEAAHESVHMQFYLFKDSSFTEHLAVLLVRRARAGVRVRILVDALYSAQELLGITNRVLEGLGTEAGIEVVAVDPIRSAGEIEAVRLKLRDHRKLVVVDGRAAFVTGRNASDEYYTGFEEAPIADWTPADRIPWLDAHVEVRGPLVEEIQRTFLETWERNGGHPIPPGETAYPHPSPAGGCSARFVVHEGVADSTGLLAYEAILDAASDHVFVLNDFPVVASLAAALRRAVARGVEVVFLTGNAIARRMDGSFFKGGLHRELFEYMTKKRFEPLIAGGVQVYEYTTPALPNIVSRGGAVRPYVHAKVVAADGRVVSIGSANLDATASYWESEANVIVENPALARDVEGEIRRMVERSYRIRLESDYWKQEIAQREIVSRLWPEQFMT